jgi:hypothetical protein
MTAITTTRLLEAAAASFKSDDGVGIVAAHERKHLFGDLLVKEGEKDSLANVLAHATVAWVALKSAILMHFGAYLVRKPKASERKRKK